MSDSSHNTNIRTQGILPVQQLKMLHRAGIITAGDDYPIEPDQFQPNSLDLRLGKKAYRVRSSFLPERTTVAHKLQKLKQYEFSIKAGAILETNCVYLIPLLERLHLPDNRSSQMPLFASPKDDRQSQVVASEPLSGKANPKSTTGRLDIFTRVITDYSHRFEEISAGYQGRLYLEVVPKSFPIRVKTGHRLNQLRIHHGHSELSDQDLLRLHNADPLLFNTDGSRLQLDDLTVQDGLFLSVNLQVSDGRLVGYKAKKHRDIINLDKINHYAIDDFWEPVFARPDDHLILEPEAFYIFASKERCRIPRHLAAEMIAYDTGSGELRTHYAGFFDSGFGGSVSDKGARAVLEVRSHDVPFLIEDGQTFFSMKFEHNTEIPNVAYGTDIKSNYQGQDLKLSKHFKSD